VRPTLTPCIRLRSVHDLIFHITTRAAWERARESGRYVPQSLEAEGFMHFCAVEQVAGAGDAHFAGMRDLVLLWVAVSRLRAPLKYERSEDGEVFPHLYGALNPDAVVGVAPFVEGDAGFVLPPEVLSLATRRPAAPS
jgi:uncharacterized protein (DUF952 family)